MARFIDLSHTIADGTITHKGLPAPRICDFLSREDSRPRYTDGTEFQIGQLTMVANTGTYIDCPFHRFAQGSDLSEVALERMADLPGVVVRVRGRTRIGPDAFDGVDVAGRAVLVETGWCAHWDTPAYLDGHPFLTGDAAASLAGRGARLVGIDSHNIDDTAQPNSRPVHTELLGRGILIVEHMRGLEQLPDADFRFSAVPPKFKGMGTFPVRAFATLA
jgi:kynurenine formamidase